MNKEKTPKYRALIVDDDSHVCEFIKAHAEAHDFKTTTLSKPENFGIHYGLALDLIVLDLNMPQVDGIELIRFLGENGSEAQIILISAAEKSILLAAQNLAINHNLSVVGVLDKPINSENLNQLILASLEGIKAQSLFSSVHGTLVREGTKELPSLEDMISAITNDQIDVHFQPKIHLKDQTVSGVEALARWNHPEKGFIPPDYFIPFAEKYGLIHKLTDQIIAKVCSYTEHWEGIPKSVQISINISEISLGDLEFPDDLTQVVKNNGMLPSQFILEITESTLSINPKAALDVLTRLRLQGYSLSIDDFGTGHSSLARLRQIPFSELKIDKSFIAESNTSSECRIIVKNTIELADKLGLTVVAEGAEVQNHIDLLADYGCDIVQGYFYSKPLENDQFVQWYSDWTNSHETDDQEDFPVKLKNGK